MFSARSVRLWGDQSDALEETEVYDRACELSIEASIYRSVREGEEEGLQGDGKRSSRETVIAGA